jgi:uncharacterized protein YdeI (BOF family)
MKKLFYSMFMLAAMLSFTACEDVPAPYDIPNASGGESGDDADYSAAAGSGTLADPFNTTAILKLASELDADAQSDQEYYFKGKVVSVTEQFGTQYGNATFYMSDDGTTKNQFYVFRALYFNNKKYTSGTTLKEGDEVVVCGKVTNFKGNTPETVQGSCYVYSINGTGGGGGSSAETIGTIDNPKSVSDVVTIINSMADNQTSNELYYVKGTIKQIKTTDENIAKYKNIDYIITDGKTDITVYHGRNLDNTEFTGPGQINVNDEVIVLGNLQKYVNANTGAVTPELAQGNYIVKLTKGSGGGGGETPSTDAKKVTVAEFNAAEVNDNVWYQLTGTVENLKDGDLYGNFDLKDETGSVYVYGLLSEKGGEKKKFQDLAAAKGINNGSKITIIGTRGVFNDKIEVLNAYFVSIEGGGGSSEQGGGGSGDGPGTVSGNTITVNAADFGVANGTEMGTQTLSDGTKLVFDGGGNSNAPKYYNSGTNIRMYPKNTVTITASKNISKVVFNVDEYQGTICNASGDISASPGTIALDGKVVTISGISDKSTVITNTSSGTGAASQIRVISIEITYAN